MSIILGLATALCWGTADFLARSITRRIGSYRTLLYVQFIGFLGLGAYVLIWGELFRRSGSAMHSAWAWALVGALLNLVGSLFLYRAFEVGVLAIVSPIVASYAAITAALSLLSGEVVSRGQALGMAVTLLGVLCAAGVLVQPPDGVPLVGESAARKDAGRGIALAVLSAVAYGVAFWVLGYRVTPQLGGLVPVWIVRVVTIICLTALARPLRQSIRLPDSQGTWALIGVIGVIDTGGFVAFALGVHGSQVAIVGVLSSLFSAVTVLLAWIFLRERVAASQWLGIAGIFAGVTLVSA